MKSSPETAIIVELAAMRVVAAVPTVAFLDARDLVAGVAQGPALK